jgi:hypothetical protein
MTPLLAVRAAGADKVAFTAGGGPGPKSGGPGCTVQYADGKATIPWSECEGRSADGLRSAFWDDCHMISAFLGDAPITCRFDKPSFDRHYADVAKLKASERSAAGDPDNTAGMAMKCFSEGGAALNSVVYEFALNNPKVIAGIRKRVTTVTVRYDQKAEPSAALKGKELVLTVRVSAGRESGIGSGCDWMRAGAVAAFPELKKELDDHK